MPRLENSRPACSFPSLPPFSRSLTDHSRLTQLHFIKHLQTTEFTLSIEINFLPLQSRFEPRISPSVRHTPLFLADHDQEGGERGKHLSLERVPHAVRYGGGLVQSRLFHSHRQVSSLSLHQNYFGLGVFRLPAETGFDCSTPSLGRKSAGTLSLECKWTGCQARASKRDHLTSHCRVHIALKPHVCPVSNDSISLLSTASSSC